MYSKRNDNENRKAKTLHICSWFDIIIVLLHDHSINKCKNIGTKLIFETCRILQSHLNSATKLSMSLSS